MNAGCSLEPTNNPKKRAFRLAGVPAGIALTLATAFTLVGSAGAGTARTTVAPSNTSLPTISGTVQEGQTLTAAQGGWNGTAPITFTYVWQRCDARGAHCANIKGATASTYKVQKPDVKHTLRVVVTAKNADGTSSATSAATVVAKAATPPGAPDNTSLPTISGTPQEGQTLTVAQGAWNGTAPITFTFAWQRCDANAGHCANIGGATHTTYVVQKADVGNLLRVVVTAKNVAGTTSATSAPTAVNTVAPAPAQTVSLSRSTSIVVYRSSVTLSGTISTGKAGESVTVLAARYPASTTLAPLATVTTSSGGAWTYSTKPTIQTSYQASWNGKTSSTLSVAVRPLVTFNILSGNRFSTKVVGGRSFASRIVQLQRRSSGRWVTLKRVHLNARSAAIFRATVPKGTSTLRIAISVNQAGAGYLGGSSRTIVYHRG